MTIFHYETFESTLKFLDSKGIANEILTRSIQSWWIWNYTWNRSNHDQLKMTVSPYHVSIPCTMYLMCDPLYTQSWMVRGLVFKLGGPEKGRVLNFWNYFWRLFFFILTALRWISISMKWFIENFVWWLFEIFQGHSKISGIQSFEVYKRRNNTFLTLGVLGSFLGVLRSFLGVFAHPPTTISCLRWRLTRVVRTAESIAFLHREFTVISYSIWEPCLLNSL